jgi:uncharacterized membrane protein YeaQ/YmgE (transglycosylase-associated protein family)
MHPRAAQDAVDDRNAPQDGSRRPSADHGVQSDRCHAILGESGKQGDQAPMFNIIGAIFSGLFIGILARFFYPGAVAMGTMATILLGIAGSLVAGLVTSKGQQDFSRAGCLASILGGMALIFIGRALGIGG